MLCSGAGAAAVGKGVFNKEEKNSIAPLNGEYLANLTWPIFRNLRNLQSRAAPAKAKFNKALKVNARSNLARRGLRQTQENRG